MYADADLELHDGQDEHETAVTLMAMDDDELDNFADWLAMVSVIFDEEMRARRTKGH
jgi:hypothetical protein